MVIKGGEALESGQIIEINTKSRSLVNYWFRISIDALYFMYILAT